MNQTVNLHLPQWQATDRIHHDDFNDAFAAIDAAIGAIPTVKLKDQTLASPTATWNIDVSGIDFTQYRKIELDIYMPVSNDISASLRVNNVTSYTEKNEGSINSRDALMTFSGYDPQCFVVFSMPMTGRAVSCLSTRVLTNQIQTYWVAASSVTWDALNSFQLIRTGGSLTAIPAGSRFILNGYKK